MRIAFLFEDTGICGASRVQLALADALTARGHEVRCVTPGLPLTWRASRAEWVYVDALSLYVPREEEVVIGRSFHLDTTPVVDEEVYRDRFPRPNEPPRVLLYGASQAETKGIDDGYGAASHARWFHQQFELIRVSPWAPSREEPLDTVQEFHVALTAAEMTRLLHSCDILIAPNRPPETFGLTAAEALAAGVCVVMTSIPAFLAFSPRRDFALFAPPDHPDDLGERLIDALDDESLRARLRTAGRAVAEGWRAGRAAEQLERLLER
ncbi:MAG TPA: glycosyltransferase [Thermoanaerobaculia bacterium]|jgi:glycosyltransferase involved in cell wall biosynthesis|nr:glycosyltransferase [Thermoanaerobaculia bacterium]